jgi:hypothetical protein
MMSGHNDMDMKSYAPEFAWVYRVFGLLASSGILENTASCDSV